MPRGDYDEPGRPTDLENRNLPDEWVGIYRTVDDVPDKYRLRAFESDLAALDPDPFDDYLAFRDDLGEWTREQKHGKAYRNFADFMGECGRHPAAPTPDHVVDFFDDVADGRWSNVKERELSTVNGTYLIPLKDAFDWFMHRVDYPHVYNPVTMAALRECTLRDAWVWRVRRDESRWQTRSNEGEHNE